MLRDFLAGNTDIDPAKLASAAGLPNDPELVPQLIGQLQQALQNSSDGINWDLALEQAKGLAGRRPVVSLPAEQSRLEQALHVAALWLDEATDVRRAHDRARAADPRGVGRGDHAGLDASSPSRSPHPSPTRSRACSRSRRPKRCTA